MKFIVDNWMLILLAMGSGGMLLMPLLTQGAGAGGVSTAEAVRLINREKGVLIDVCESAEFNAGHAIGARNIPLSTLADAKGLPTNKALPVLVMCATGARARRAVGQLHKAGYTHAKAVTGGMSAWREANLPVEKA